MMMDYKEAINRITIMKQGGMVGRLDWMNLTAFIQSQQDRLDELTDKQPMETRKEKTMKPVIRMQDITLQENHYDEKTNHVERAYILIIKPKGILIQERDAEAKVTGEIQFDSFEQLFNTLSNKNSGVENGQ